MTAMGRARQPRADRCTGPRADLNRWCEARGHQPRCAGIRSLAYLQSIAGRVVTKAGLQGRAGAAVQPKTPSTWPGLDHRTHLTTRQPILHWQIVQWQAWPFRRKSSTAYRTLPHRDPPETSVAWGSVEALPIRAGHVRFQRLIFHPTATTQPLGGSCCNISSTCWAFSKWLDRRT